MFKFKNGAWAVDVVTGFAGRVTGRVDYITGCRQYLVQPAVNEEGDYKSALWFDESRLKVSEDNLLELPQGEAEVEGSCDAAPVR